MAITINDQYRQFVQFADRELRSGNIEAVARAGAEVGAGLDARSIAATTTNDKVHKFFRWSDDKTANDNVRRLFRESVERMFGGAQFLPEEVKTAMRLTDYGSGKPLTARRINIVKTAIDNIIDQYRGANNDVMSKIVNKDIEHLPEEIKNSLAGVVNGFRSTFGADRVPPGADITRFLNPARVQTALYNLRDTATAQARNVAGDAIAQIFAAPAYDRLVLSTVGAHIIPKIMQHDPNAILNEIAIGTQFKTAYPALDTEIRQATNPEEVAAAFERHAEEVNKFVDTFVRCNAANKQVASKAEEKLASALGLDKNLVAMHFELKKLTDEAKNLTTAIMSRTAPGCREEGYNIEAQYDAIVQRFVQKRIDTFAAVNQLNLPQGMKNPLDVLDRWKAEYTGYDHIPNITPSQMLQVLDRFDVKRLIAAFSPALPSGIAAGVFKNITDELAEAIKTATNNPNFFAGNGVDDEMPILTLLIVAAEAKDEKLAQAIKDANTPANGDNVLSRICASCENDSFEFAATLAKTLMAKGGPVKAVPITNKEKFMGFAQATAEKVLDECGITNAKVRADVLKAVNKRAGATLDGATGLKSLSDFVARLKDNVTDMAKVLDSIMKARTGGAEKSISTTIVTLTKLNKGYVLNNLDLSDLTSDSGSFRFLYDSQIKRFDRGEPIDVAGTLNKSNDIIAKFARDKVNIINTIKDTGFRPEDRARHIASALHDRAWFDADVCNVAKALAEKAEMKNAAKMLAVALQKQALESIDDDQLLSVFKFFSQAFLTAFKTGFPNKVQDWGGNVEMQTRLNEMMIQLLEKETPGLLNSLAHFAQSGRFATVYDKTTNELTASNTLKMDYAMLKQYNYLGAPAGERERALLTDPNLVFNEAEYLKCQLNHEVLEMTGQIVGVFRSYFPGKEAINAEKYIAYASKGREVIDTYSKDLPQDTVHLLAKLVRVLDWRPNAVAKSEEIVKKYVEDMKMWRDIALGADDSKGLAEVFQRRMNGYMKDSLAGLTTAEFDRQICPGLFGPFLDDISRDNKLVINGKNVTEGNITLEQKIARFNSAIKDPNVRKVVSIMTNQQIFADYVGAVANRVGMTAWKQGMEEETVDNVPGIEKFATRDISKMLTSLLATGKMEFRIEVSPDEKTVKVHASSASPMHASYWLGDASIGKCRFTQEFVIDMTGEEPVIKDLKIGQKFEEEFV